jgi:anti-sigma B factor antagonist
MQLPEVQFERVRGVVVGRLEISLLTEPQLREAMEEMHAAIRMEGASRFVLDMQEVHFISSACLGCLVEFLQEIEHYRGRLALAGCNKDVAFLFRVTKLDDVIPLHDDVDEAVDAVLG